MTLLESLEDTDNDAPVDATSTLLGTDFDGDIQDGFGLIKRLSTSQMVHDCLVTNLYRYEIIEQVDLNSRPFVILNLVCGKVAVSSQTFWFTLSAATPF